MSFQQSTHVPAIAADKAGTTAFLSLSGSWLLEHAAAAETLVQTVHLGKPALVEIDLAQVGELDTAGAWLIHRLRARCEFKGARVRLSGLPDKFNTLVEEITSHHPPPWKSRRRRISLVWLAEATGRQMVEVYKDSIAVLHILGTLGTVVANVVVHPSRLRLISVAHQFDRAGIGAIPIVMLMSFLIGGIITQQGGFYLLKFGASRYAVDLVGVLALREIGVLLTAIMVAGRSGSAFTAELGAMKMQEEIDALQVIGLRVTEVLVLPRILALMLALPMLAFFANLAALAGGCLVSWAYLGIQPQNFMQYLHAAVDLQTVMIGLVKAPFMALIIGLVACVEGLKVEGSSESLGLHTTLSVVKAIFMVIVVDGVFAMFFAALGI